MIKLSRLLFLFFWFLWSCTTEDNSFTSICDKYIYGVSGEDIHYINFPNAPFEIFSHKDHDVRIINYFNIIQVSDSLYYLYYASIPKDEIIDAYNYNLYLAISKDGIHYEDYYHPSGGGRIIKDEMKEQSVIYTPNEEYKFKLLCNIFEDGIDKLVVFFSNDGIHFDLGRKILLATIPHDTQNVIVTRNGGYDLYTRLWLPNIEHRSNRKIAKCHYDKDFAQTSELVMLEKDYMYTNAATKIDSEYDLLIPTYFNNLESGGSQECHLETYLCNRLGMYFVDNNFNKWINYNQVKWIMAAPGIIKINNHFYMAYMTNDEEHDYGYYNGNTKYYLIEIEFKKSNI